MSEPASTSIPIEFNDEINSRILSISEDKIQGFVRKPMEEIARLSGVKLETVIERIQAMLQAGTIRRVRQTLMSVNLAPGALVAWKCPEKKLVSAFNYMWQQDPFSGHVVFRSTDTVSAGSDYKLWTTLKVPQGYSMDKHCEILMSKTGATAYRLMPAKGVFALGVGHVRRKEILPGAKIEGKAKMMKTSVTKLNEEEWKILLGLKREFKPEEITPNLWLVRAKEIGIDFERFCEVAKNLNDRGVIGRFSTFLEHVKPSKGGQRVTRFNGLFHWAVPQDRVHEAGTEIGRHHILTHCYWREGGPEFKNVNIMAVAHGTEKALTLEHKAAIDKHLENIGMPVSYTNVFWGGKSEIKPSEIHPQAYAQWLKSVK
ncbi:MAG: Lrp/AsnC family transcriptional regulator [Verrucomicrobiota bacterium]